MDEERKSNEGSGSGTNTVDEIKKELQSIPATVAEVIKNPVGFYKKMPKTGGFVSPLIFMVAMGVAGGLIQAVKGVVGLMPVGGFFMAVAAVVIVPVVVVIFGFIAAAVFFVIWKIMGSGESYETAYRSIAYASAITPVTAVLDIVPYAGGIAGLVWMTYLIITASIEVHSISSKPAWVVFGALCAVLSLMSLSAEYAGRRFQSEMKSFQKGMDKKVEDVTPEEMGKAMGEFFKGMQEAEEKK